MSTYVHLPTEVQAFQWDGTVAGGEALAEWLLGVVISLPGVYFPIVRLTKYYSTTEPTTCDLQVSVDGTPNSVGSGGWVIAEPHKWPKVRTEEEFNAEYVLAG